MLDFEFPLLNSPDWYREVGLSYKKECQEKNLPHRLNTAPFLSRHSAHCLSVVFLRAESLVSSPRAKRRYASSPCGVLFPVVTAPIVSETTSLTVVHCMSGNAWWQRMVLLETRGLWLYSIVRGGIGWQWRLACVKHGPNKPMDTSPRNRASREPDGPPLGMISPGGTESQPEALTLLVISNSWRRNVPPTSRRSM